jgi:hypothetical protein
MMAGTSPEALGRVGSRHAVTLHSDAGRRGLESAVGGVVSVIACFRQLSASVRISGVNSPHEPLRTRSANPTDL